MTAFRSPDAVDPRAVISFWRAAGPARWFSQDERFDALVLMRLGTLHAWAAIGALDHLARTPEGSLALLILLDQAPRNMFRGSARAFETDADARDVAEHAIDRGFDRRVPYALRSFFYLPFMHSENLEDQALCVELYRRAGDMENLRWAELHRDIIEKFGRFPHRNALLGRDTTAEEGRYLDEGGFRG
ncbi:DUF924 family protein [Flaviflagellibacter deserti]|uniref:DUF924 family protein n=1 Tax=Flaviflagellibacter deserti TaxID=2267266 RepID=A0ABV9YZH5_9HYPH